MNKENEEQNLDCYCRAHVNKKVIHFYYLEKKAKYKILGVPAGKSKFNLTDLVCSKCAIGLVASGYKVEEINGDQT